MAALCCLVLLACLKTALCSNITLQDQNETFDPQDLLNITQLANTPTPSFVSESTDTSLPKTTPDVPRVALPLPLSGVLPTPVTEVIKVCPCNTETDQCDVNCCCDPDCTDEQALFTECSVKAISGDPRLCQKETVVYSISSSADDLSGVQTSVLQEVNPDVFCVQSANYDEGLSFATPEIPTEENFDSLFAQFVAFFFGRPRDNSATQISAVGDVPGYVYGDVIQTLNEAGEQNTFPFPASAGTSHCLDANPAAFLKEQTSRCIRSFALAQDCSTLGALNLRTYIALNIRSGKNNEAKIIGVEVSAITLESLEGTWTSVDPSESDTYFPVLLESGDVCNNVVKQVKYIFRYSEVGEILSVMASFLLGAINSVTMPIQQEFQIVFLQEITSIAEIKFSGNPGYVVGLPLVAGTRTPDGIVQSNDPKGSLSILQNSVEQDCLLGSSRWSPVLFGIDMISGCTLRISDAVNCSLLSEVLLSVMKGHNFPDHVASFGNSLPQNPLDWVPIQNQTITQGTQACSIPLSRHLEVKWTKYGTLGNPQAQIVNVMETVLTNTSSLALLTNAGGLLSVTTSVSFIDVSSSAKPGLKVPPTIDAKLPIDFFFPFV